MEKFKMVVTVDIEMEFKAEDLQKAAEKLEEDLQNRLKGTEYSIFYIQGI